MPARPLVAVITAVRNGEATLGRTLESVGRQTWRPLEHIVVDGASTDGTRAILERQGDRLRWVSEPDRGLYDAMNKGLALLRDPEAYVLFLNADDAFHSDDAVERALGAAAGEDLIYGRLERFDEELDYRDIIGHEVTARDMVLGMRCHHQAMFTRARVFDRIGGFDLRYRIASDYDWAVRAMLNGSVSKRFVQVVIATMSRGGLSDRYYLRSVRERWHVVRRHYPLAELLRYTVWTGFGDYLRYYTQQGLKRMGLLNRARDAKRRFQGAALPPRSARE
jgi:glycosyltransferase involved in cell wall biosynthesis